MSKTDLFESLTNQARRTNAERDSVDRSAGFAAPVECDLLTQLRTVLCALQSGMETQDWNCVAEGYVMLEGVERRTRQRGRSVRNGG